ncbi:MAG: hypothetical protein AAF741_10690 [Bacteroidota bacterium]
MKRRTPVWKRPFILYDVDGKSYINYVAVVTTFAAIITLFGFFSSTKLDSEIASITGKVIHLIFILIALSVNYNYSFDKKFIHDNYSQLRFCCWGANSPGELNDRVSWFYKIKNQVISAWFGLCACWAAFYLIEVLIFLQSGGEIVNTNNHRSFIFSVLNNVSSGFVCYFYLLLAFSEFPESGESKVTKYSRIIAFVVIVLIILDLYFIYDESALKSNLYTVLTLEILSGFLSSISFALLAGRLDSRYAGFKEIWIAILYIYAIVFFVFPVAKVAYSLNIISINQTHSDAVRTLEMIVYYIAFFGKLTLFGLIYNGIKTHKLFLYIINIPVLTSDFKKKKDNYLKLLNSGLKT